MNRIAKVLLIVSGTFFVALGVLGIFVPVLPTTPFLLVAAFCYARSSERFLHWLLTNRWFGAYIKNYREGRGISLREKLLTIVALWLSVSFSALYVVESWWGKLLLVAVAVGVTVHLLRIKTPRADAKTHPVGKPHSPDELEFDHE
jgi:uncharacterized membrane protein YbaN (DUF454 family)